MNTIRAAKKKEFKSKFDMGVEDLQFLLRSIRVLLCQQIITHDK
jgi:hypothetical protein